MRTTIRSGPVRSLVAALAAAATCMDAHAETPLDRLVAAYPDALERVDGDNLVWRDGTRMAIDDGIAAKTPAARIADPDIKDMLAEPYPAGGALAAPAVDADPGRARNAAFFSKLYGDCKAGGVTAKLVDIAWVPSHGGGKMRVTSAEGVAVRLAAVSARLDRLPKSFDPYLLRPGGGYACRPIAATDRQSAHGYGIAVDIGTARANYWQWTKAAPGGFAAYHNEIPPEIVAAFEAEGFIWGGRWSHFDTMHFEYRPELFPTRTQAATAR